MKYIKYVILSLFCVFSFYVSDRLLLLVEGMSPLMQTINETQDFKEYAPVNAIIDGNKIIPGKKGRTINKRETYLKMNDFGTFNETFFVYDYINPEISLSDNLDKIIVKGQDNTKVSLIVDSPNFDEYFSSNNISYTKLVKSNDMISNNELVSYINANLDENAFYDLNYYLKRKKLNDRICVVGLSNIKVCTTLKYYLVEPSLNLYKMNVYNIKKNISGGDIIYIHDDVSLALLQIILQDIKAKNLQIVPLKDLIKE